MNFHVVSIHFPIAFLSLYSVLELLRFRRLNRELWLQQLKALLVVLGFISAVVSYQTGDMIQRQFRTGSLKGLVQTHAWFAGLTLIIYGVIALGYLIALLKPRLTISSASSSTPKYVGEALAAIERVLALPAVRVMFALAGLAAVTVTGALGGAIVYGPDVDPIVKIIYAWTVR